METKPDASRLRPLRVDDPAALADPRTIESLTGPIAGIERSPLTTPGFSGSSHERLTVRLASGGTRSLVLKRTRVAADWTLVRSEDRVGREGRLLAEPALAGVWEAFACPYLAWAATEGELALLMEDLADHLLPDAREPMAETQEHRILAALANLHARFWEAPALQLPWLTRPHHLFGLIGARAIEAEASRGFAHPVQARAHEGWQVAFAHLPPGVAALMREPATALAERSARLPRTLTHGDVKVANFALLPDGRVAAFDWALVGRGPVALELGWYLAVNATRLSGSKEESIARYRRQLEEALARPLGEAFWAATEANAALAGGAMLLWSKALALASGGPRARTEWDWWVERLAAL
jgi:hypothetical protein